MRATLLAVAALCLLLVALAAFAPATLVDQRLAALTGDRLRLADARGSIWSGEGRLTDLQGLWQIPLAWRLSPASLARGALEARLSPLAGATPVGLARATTSGLALSQFSAEVPAAALSGLLPDRDAYALGGSILVSTPAFTVDAARATGGLAATWRNARARAGDQSLDLGTVSLNLAAQDTRLSGRVTNQGGELRIDGAVSISRQDLVFDGTLAPAAGAPANVARMLAALGPADGNGAVRFNWRGRLQ